jgi:hypothetical protein
MDRKPEDCTYCGKPASRGEGDHITAKCWFPGMPNKDLLAVPSCKKCNESFAKDDEYFMYFLSFDYRTELHPLAKPLIEKARSSRIKKWDDPFMVRIRSQIKILYDQWPHPRDPMQAPMKWDYEKNRIAGTSTRIVKGLYRLVFHTRVPPSHAVFCAPLPLPEGRDADLERIVAFLEQAEVRHYIKSGFKELALHKACQGAFTYRWGYMSRVPEETGWTIEFYGGLTLSGAVAPIGSPVWGSIDPKTGALSYSVSYRLYG